MIGLFNAYTHHIFEAYLACTMYIQLKFYVYEFQIIWYIYGICMVCVKHITSIYLSYDNNNLPSPCTLTHPILAPGTQHPPARRYGSWIFPTLLVYRRYQNQLHHERLARCPLSHEWAVLVADKTFFYYDISLIYYAYPLIYYAYPLDIHSISKVYHYKKRYRTNPWGFY